MLPSIKSTVKNTALMLILSSQCYLLAAPQTEIIARGERGRGEGSTMENRAAEQAPADRERRQEDQKMQNEYDATQSRDTAGGYEMAPPALSTP